MSDRLALLEGLLGRPYAIGARGPDAFDCYGLAAHVQQAFFGVAMPEVAFAERTVRAQAEAMLAHPERERWQEVPELEARDGDLVLMGNVAKRDFHLGTLIQAATVPVVLHTDQAIGVVVHDLPALRAIGFNHLTFYRRIA